MKSGQAQAAKKTSNRPRGRCGDILHSQAETTRAWRTSVLRSVKCSVVQLVVFSPGTPRTIPHPSQASPPTFARWRGPTDIRPPAWRECLPNVSPIRLREKKATC